MVTLTGNWVNPANFTLSPLDAALHLGRLPRFGGTTKGWWTGLQHALLVARLCRKHKGTKGTAASELIGLWHDAHEIVTGDWVRPWKTDAVKEVQKQIDVCIAASVGLPEFDLVDQVLVKTMDDLACNIEAHIMAPVVVTRHPDSFGKREDAERYLRDGLFDGLWTGDLLFDVRSTWSPEGELVRLFVKEHERLMTACGATIRPPKTITID